MFAVATSFFLSPQKTNPFLNANGEVLENSIAEIRDVTLNGVSQRILIRGVDVNNPVLLHLHGGPGGADQAIVRSNSKTLEDIFTVVYWDQRGAGASYSSSVAADDLSLDQIVADGVVLSETLRQEFKKDKIYLQGHSWGTLVGVHMIAKAPDLYHAYFGIGQIAHSKRAELLSFSYTMNAAKIANDKKTMNKLAELGSPPYENDQRWIDSVMQERVLMQPYEVPNQRPFLSLAAIYKNFVFYPEYSLSDKLNSLAGSKLSLQALWMEAINANLFITHPTLPVPVYFFQGKYDQHTVTEVAKDYFDAVEAPHKEYFSFDNSAHWPHLKEEQKYREIVKKIVAQ